MKKIGCFRKENAEWIGTIAVLQFEAKARIVTVPNKTSTVMPDYRLIKVGGAGGFEVELGAAWERYSQTQRISYKEVSLDDPALSHSIKAILWEDMSDGYWYLYWDRTSSSEHMAEALYIQEELKPQLGIRPIARVTQNMMLFYPDLVPG